MKSESVSGAVTGGRVEVGDIGGMAREVRLDELEQEIERILQGQQTGRIVVKLATDSA